MRVGLVASALKAEIGDTGESEKLLNLSGGNTGNFAFVQALYQHLGKETQVLPWTTAPEEMRERCDLLVMACANQLGPHTDLGALAATFEKANLPILAIGLGAQAPSDEHKVQLTEGTKRWLNVVAASSPANKPNIGVRGEFSRQQVEGYGVGDMAVITGCPSNFLNCDPLLAQKIVSKTENKIDRIAGAAGLIYWDNLASIEQLVADAVTTTQGIYITQHELNMIRISRQEFDAIDDQTLNRINKYIRPGANRATFISWCVQHARSYPNAPSWMSALRDVDFVIGARFHGIMLGLQAGTPGLVIAHDSRTFEMCHTMCVPVVWHADIEAPTTVEQLAEKYPFEAAAFDNRRRSLGARFVGLYEDAGLPPPGGIKALLAQGKHYNAAT